MNELNEISNVVKLDFSKKFNTPTCQHQQFTIYPYAHTVMCNDCGAFVDAFFALEKMLAYWDNYVDQMEAQKSKLDRAILENLFTIAAKRADDAWRKKNSVPLCPHCEEAIFADDGFGNKSMNKNFAIRIRKKYGLL